jgi:hypothetical protein
MADSAGARQKPLYRDAGIGHDRGNLRNSSQTLRIFSSLQ